MTTQPTKKSPAKKTARKRAKPSPSAKPNRQESAPQPSGLPSDALLKEQIREAMEAGNVDRAAELMSRLRNPPLPSNKRAIFNLTLTAILFLLFLWYLIPATIKTWQWWF